MNKRKSINIINFYNVMLFCFTVICTSGAVTPAVDSPILPLLENTAAAPRILFSFKEEPLVDVITMVAKERGINIVMPAGNDAITSKLTLHIERPLSNDEAWDMLHTILDVAGYSLVLRGSMYAIVKNSKALIKEPVPLYIGVPGDQLPDSDQHIRYLYYLSNIKISEESNTELDLVLQTFLSETGSYKTDIKTNGILIADKASNIKEAMFALKELDRATFQEKLEVINLLYVNADFVAKLFEDNIFKNDREPQRYGLRDKKPLEQAHYFSRNIKMIPEIRQNKLILIGREQAVTRFKDFITTYIDVGPESGQSILHVYQLQYLDAYEFAPVLDNIVKSSRFQGSGQSSAEQKQGGTERFFEGVIVKTDKPQSAGGGPNTGEIKYSGGNKLIIAAKNDDWKIIKQLIEDLDKPQRTVILEALIVDLTTSDARALGTSLRVPAGIPMPTWVNLQTTHVTGDAILNNPITTPATPDNSTLATDLLHQPSLPSASPTTNYAAVAPSGATLISLNDPTGPTWGIMQLLQNFIHSKILSHPHVVATNNRTATIVVGEERLLQDEAVSAVAPIVKFKIEKANLKVEITPRISSSNTVSLKVSIDITEFIAGNSNARIVRNMETVAEIHTGAVLALGGLIRVDSSIAVAETPILSKIPILGWFFKNRRGNNAKTNLTVFISPTIIEPRLRSGVGQYTIDHLGIAQQYTKEGELFDNLHDPITRFFFKDPDDDGKLVRDFLAKDEFKVTKEILAKYEFEKADAQKKNLPRKNTKSRLKEAVTKENVIPKKQSEGLTVSVTQDLKELLKDTKNPLELAQVNDIKQDSIDGMIEQS